MELSKDRSRVIPSLNSVQSIRGYPMREMLLFNVAFINQDYRFRLSRLIEAPHSLLTLGLIPSLLLY